MSELTGMDRAAALHGYALNTLQPVTARLDAALRALAMYEGYAQAEHLRAEVATANAASQAEPEFRRGFELGEINQRLLNEESP